MDFRHLDDLLTQFTTMKRGPVGCALSVSLNGETVYTGYRGYANLQENKKIAPDTLYRMYSSTKVVTAVAMMILLEKGLYQLDDPISQYLPEFENAKFAVNGGNNLMTLVPVRSLTVKHFLTMTSGLTYGGDLTSTHHSIRGMLKEINDNGGGITVREFSRRAARIPLAFEPGTSWNYGINLDVLGAFIEVVSGKRFHQFLQDEIYTPLGMTETSFFLDDERLSRLATMYCYDERDQKIVNDADVFKFRESYMFERGGAGIVTTLEDMTRFTQMLSMGGTLNGVRIIGRKTVELMRQNHLNETALQAFRRTHEYGWNFMSGYGYGLGVKTLMSIAEANCPGSVGEFSWAGAAGTLTLIDPVEKLSIVYMQQLKPQNREEYCHPRLRNVIYGLLD